MEIAVLGPLEVRDDGGSPVRLAGPRLRALLARLALCPGQAVAAPALVRDLWEGDAPRDALNALQSLVSRLRRALAAGVLEWEPGGYRLVLQPEAVDAARFERLAARGRDAGRRGDAAGCAAVLAEALGLWRGEPLQDLGGFEFAAAAAARWSEVRLSAVAERAEALLALGAAADAVAELEAATAEHPWHEHLRALYLRALSAAGRPAQALAAFESLRADLARELGTDPSPELRALHVAILRDEAGAAAPPPPTHLPGAWTELIGRERDLEQVGALLRRSRLLTLVGPGGVGKSRLAVAAAAEHARHGGERAWLVDLAGVAAPADVPSAIAGVLGLPSPGREAEASAARLAEGVGARPLLLVLDHCERLVAACAHVAEAVLGRCGGVRILAVSRQPLGLPGEALWQVRPLPLPRPGAGPAEAAQSPALRLFAERAAAARPGFQIGTDNVEPAAEVCRRLDGLPLAIELACARLRTLPLAELAAGLDDRFRLLTAGSRAAPPRQQTLLAVVRWSWDLLAGPERTLARRLAVFGGRPTAASAAAVCAGPDLAARDVPGLLGDLVDRSLLELVEHRDEGPRYRMLETIRAFAAEELEAAGEAPAVQRAHAAHLLALAEDAERALRGPGQARAVARLRAEYEDLTAAMRWALASDAPTAVALVAALGWYWTLRGDHREAASWLHAALDLPRAGLPSPPLQLALASDAMHAFALWEPERASASLAEALALARDDPAPHPVVALAALLPRLRADPSARRRPPGWGTWLGAMAEMSFGHAAEYAGDAAGAARHFESALEGFTEAGDAWGVGAALGNLGASRSVGGDPAAAVAGLDPVLRFADRAGAADAAWWLAQRGAERLRAGDPDGARADFEAARTAAVDRGQAEALAQAELGLGELARAQGDAAGARRLLAAAVQGMERAGAPPVLCVPVRVALARAELAGGDREAARADLARAMAAALGGGHRGVMASVGEALAELVLAEGDPAGAARLLGLAAASRGSLDRGSPDVRAAEAEARAALGGAYSTVHGPAAALTPAEAEAELAGAATAAQAGRR